MRFTSTRRLAGCVAAAAVVLAARAPASLFPSAVRRQKTMLTGMVVACAIGLASCKHRGPTEPTEPTGPLPTPPGYEIIAQGINGDRLGPQGGYSLYKTVDSEVRDGEEHDIYFYYNDAGKKISYRVGPKGVKPESKIGLLTDGDGKAQLMTIQPGDGVHAETKMAVKIDFSRMGMTSGGSIQAVELEVFSGETIDGEATGNTPPGRVAFVRIERLMRTVAALFDKYIFFKKPRTTARTSGGG